MASFRSLQWLLERAHVSSSPVQITRERMMGLTTFGAVASLIDRIKRTHSDHCRLHCSIRAGWKRFGSFWEACNGGPCGPPGIRSAASPRSGGSRYGGTRRRCAERTPHSFAGCARDRKRRPQHEVLSSILSIERSPAASGCPARLIRTLKENLLRARTSLTTGAPRPALLESSGIYQTICLIERRGCLSSAACRRLQQQPIARASSASIRCPKNSVQA